MSATTQLGDRLVLTLAMLALMGLIYALMWRGWRRRERIELPPLPVPPVEWQQRTCADAIYASTTMSGQWLGRLRAQQLGSRSRARVCIGQGGVLIERTGAPNLFIPRDRIRGVALAPGIAGKVVGGRGVVVITWSLGEHEVDTGFLPDLDRRSEIVAATMELIDA